MRLLDTGFVLASIIPESVKDFVYCHPDQRATMTALDEQNRKLREAEKNIFDEPNIGDCVVTPWYTDESFGQQQLTGTNPATIEIASEKWASEFQHEASKQGKVDMERLISDAANSKSLYVQDCSYFRAAIGVRPTSDLSAGIKDSSKARYACASLTLFHLTPEGKLHPVAIVIDYKQDMDHSVVIFNKRIDPNAQLKQATDWPWRYAKTCATSADWIRHEVKVHLVDCHFVEEATIVAAHRSLPTNHLVYRCLEPHWLKTFPLKAAARTTLVPHVVIPLIGLDEDSGYTLIRTFITDSTGSAIMFPTTWRNEDFRSRNLTTLPSSTITLTARRSCSCGTSSEKFVKAFLANEGKGLATDEAIAKDEAIADWCREMQSDAGGQMKSWPTIKTVDQLVDCVTLCIHIASPQHTAVNYLQEYYNSCVVNKPPGICSPLPKTLDELADYTEKQLMEALPINRPNEWLLASHLVHLLNYQVAEDQNLINYGVSLYRLTEDEPPLHHAAKDFVDDLLDFEEVLERISSNLDNKEIPYKVLEPITNAVSILI
jgi:hypothetical protein